MKNTFKILGIVAFSALIGFSFVSCGDGGGGGYKLIWGTWEGATYSQVSINFTNAGKTLIAAGANAGYLTGVNAAEAFATVNSEYEFDDGGDKKGSFEDLVNFTNNGISAPSELKTAMLANKANVPVGGVFYSNLYGGIVIAFYIESN